MALLFAIPFLQTYLVPIFWFAAKAGFILFTYIWIRGTLPRFRYDQLMHFAWTFLFPCALINLLLTALMVAVFPDQRVMDSILFIIAAVAAIGCGLNLVLQKHPISSALSLLA